MLLLRYVVLVLEGFEAQLQDWWTDWRNITACLLRGFWIAVRDALGRNEEMVQMLTTRCCTGIPRWLAI